MNKIGQWLDALAVEQTPDFATCLRVLGDVFPLLYEFEHTEQDPQWHAEGNVAVHTNMVLAELYELLAQDAAHVKGETRQALILGALLHDIAKPLTTRRKEIAGIERVVATKHEEIGASYLATRLPLLPLSQSCIETVMALVGFHQMPKLLVVRNMDFSDYFHLALNVNLELVYWLEVADMRGRICEDPIQQLDLLEQFRLFAKEYELWGEQPIETQQLAKIQTNGDSEQQCYINGYGIRQLATGQISQIEEAVPKNFEPCRHYAHLYVMCGISGSGKSSWIKANLADYQVISLDDIRKEINGRRECQKNLGQVLQTAKQRLKVALANKQNVVWDATNIRFDFRDSICQLGLQYGALITLVAFQLTQTQLQANNKNRSRNVPDDIMAEQIEKLQWPNRTEGHRMLVIGDKGKTLSRHGSF